MISRQEIRPGRLFLTSCVPSPALGLLMVCALSWLQSALAAGSAKRLVVLDEAWAVLSHLATARWLQATFKLSRAYGVANVAVVHRLSDLKAAGQDGSQEQRLAEGLLADAETRVVFAQAPGEAERAGELLGLSRTEQLLLSQLPRGVALWRVGRPLTWSSTTCPTRRKQWPIPMEPCEPWSRRAP